MDGTETMQREAFGTWLLAQLNSGRWYAAIAKMAKGDDRFPRQGDVEAVRKHLGAGGADPETFEMIDDAERDWEAS